MSTAVITLVSDSESDSDLSEVVLKLGGAQSDDEPATEEVETEGEENFLEIVLDSDEEDEVETLIDEDEVLFDTQPEESDVFTVVDADSDEEDGPVRKPKSNQIVQYIGADDVLGARFKRRRVFDSDESDGYVSF